MGNEFVITIKGGKPNSTFLFPKVLRAISGGMLSVSESVLLAKEYTVNKTLWVLIHKNIQHNGYSSIQDYVLDLLEQQCFTCKSLSSGVKIESLNNSGMQASIGVHAKELNEFIASDTSFNNASSILSLV